MLDSVEMVTILSDINASNNEDRPLHSHASKTGMKYNCMPTTNFVSSLRFRATAFRIAGLCCDSLFCSIFEGRMGEKMWVEWKK
jgi:hypothetical protein